MKPAPETKLPFPFNQRWGLSFWNWLFADNERYQPRPEQDQAWNRGAYIVQSSAIAAPAIRRVDQHMRNAAMNPRRYF